MKRFLLVLLGLLVSLAAGAAHSTVPDIPLLDLDGKPKNVNTIIGRGQWVVVVLWTHDCRICASEIHEMADFHTAHSGRDARVLGVSLDGRDRIEAARQFVRRHQLPFVNLLAELRLEVIQKFGASTFQGTPTYYVYNPQGELVGQHIGPLTRKAAEAFINRPGPPAAARKK